MDIREKLSLAKGIVTIDIDSTAIKLLTTRGRRVQRWASAPPVPGIIEGGFILNPAALGAQVRQLMKTSHIRGNRFITSVSGLYSVSRILSLATYTEAPAGEDDLFMEETKRVLPMPLDEQYLSWQVLSTDEHEQRYLFIAMPKAVVDAQVQALRAGGINPDVMELKALALARAANREQALIVNAEPDSVDIAVVIGGKPQVLRTVAQPINLTPEDRAQHVITILEHTVGFYNSRHPQSPVDPSTPLFLAGPIVESQHIRERMEAESTYPVEPIVAPLECPPNLPVSHYAVNIGLALRELS